jgi:uncharacterized protein with LGFP repeats
MISRLASSATLVLLVGLVAVTVAPVSNVSASESPTAALMETTPAQLVRTDSVQTDPSGLPESTLTEVDVVLPAVEAGVVEESPELIAGRDDEDVVVVDEVVADRVASEIVETGTFQTLGVTWPEGTAIGELEPQVRVRTDGEWSEWLEMDQDSGGPDPGTPDAQNAVKDGTDPLWVGDSDAVQVSFLATVDAGPENLALVLVGSEEVPLPPDDVIVGTGAGDGIDVRTAAYAQGPLATAVGAPRVISRAEWGARAQVCTPDVAQQLVGAAVHHTAGSNNYATIEQAMQQIRNDQRYHIEGRGWCDLGYNFVVDKWGNIYEGRANSLTQPVVGVHAGGFNTGTVGVSMLGTYGSPPPAATLQSVAHIIGWRLGYFGVNPQGTMSYWTNVGENSKFQNTWVTLPRVFGHRDVAYTACPGDGGYNALPWIRATADSFSFGQRFAQAGAVVRAMYADLLGRGVDPTGLQTWSAMLAGGSGLPSLVGTLTNSDEYIRLRITQAYRTVLGREPEAKGLQDWYVAIRAGRATVDDVARRFLSTEEFRMRSGGTDRGYVERMYASVLGRPAAASEITYWTAEIARLGRDRVTDGIWFSNEAARQRAGVYYQTYLKRAPDPGGLVTWSWVLLNHGEGAVRIGIAGSEEYRVKALVRYP